MGSEKILIIDDEPTFAEMLKVRLEASDYTADVASGGREGLSMLDRRKYNLILLDVMMPDMDGFDVLRSIGRHRKNQHTPVIMLTAKGQTKNILEAEKLGAKDYILKPFDSAALLRTIRRHLV